MEWRRQPSNCAGARSVRATAPTDVDAETVTIVEESKYKLEGDVVVTRADQRVAADTMRYDANAARVEAEGDMHYQDEDLLLSADKATAEMAKDRVELDDVRYQLLSARGNGTAVRAVRPDKTHTELTLPAFLESSNNHFGWDVGGGLIVFPTQHFGIRGDVRYFHAFQDLEILGITLGDTKLDFGRASAGVVFKF